MKKKWSSKGHIPTARHLYLSAISPEETVQEGCERNFFHSVRLRNGTNKTTFSHRLDDLNEIINKHLPAHRPLQVMDVAVSSGISTLEWMQSLQCIEVDYCMTAGDLVVNTFLLSIGKRLHILVDRQGYPLQFDILGMPFAFPPGRRRIAVYPLLIAFRSVLPTILAYVLKDNPAPSKDQIVCRYGINCRAIALVSPRLNGCVNLTIVEDDVLNNKTLKSKFHVLRAANILNRSYFDDDTLIKMAINLGNRLISPGLLVVCRTDENGCNHGTLFQLNEKRQFCVVDRIGKGSEVENILLGLPSLDG